MESSGLKISQNCSPRPLQEYLDGELDQHQESALLEHVSTCATCNEELNFHKTVFENAGELGTSVEIPLNFAEIVTTNAESQISGLRRRKEWITALSVVAFLAFATLVLISFDLSRPLASSYLLIGKLAALACNDRQSSRKYGDRYFSDRPRHGPGCRQLDGPQ
jgi:hypothetical protein